MSPPSPSKVLMTADTVGGVWTFAVELCAGLAKYGVEVTLLSMGGLPDESQLADAMKLPNLRLVSTAHRLEWMRDCEKDVIESGRLLLQLAHEWRPDVVHVNGYYHAALPFEAPIVLTAHSCVASWWRACRGEVLPIEWRRYMQWVSAGVSRADLVTAPTQAFLYQFQAMHGRARAARAIWNGRNASFFSSGVKRNMVLAAGRLWDEAKNIPLLCRVAGQLNVPVAVAGDDVSPDGTTAELANVVWLGRLSPADIAAQMAQASVFAAPARYEPFGLSILEAALSGCALALADIPTLRELWDGAAVFISPDDDEGWLCALSQLTENPDLAYEYGTRARERAARYSAEQMTAHYLDAYPAVSTARATHQIVEAAA
jgi:glycosyltransferase involved in cell wall biosynthesis